MSSPKVIQLRQALSDKFPGLRLHLNELASETAKLPPPQSPLLHLFENQLFKGALNEVVAGQNLTGSATFMRSLLSWAAGQNQIIALIDGCDSFEVAGLERSELARLLWVRCPDAERSLKAMDLLARDGNFSLIVLDLKLNPERQLRKISPTLWYRLQRLLELTATACVVVTPQPMITPARSRITLQSDFSLADLERESPELEAKLRWEIAEARHFYQETNLYSA